MNHTKIYVGIDFLMLFSSDFLAQAGPGTAESRWWRCQPNSRDLRISRQRSTRREQREGRVIYPCLAHSTLTPRQNFLYNKYTIMASVGMVERVDGTAKNQKVILRMGAPDDLLVVNSTFSVAVGDCVAVAVGDGIEEQPKLLDEVLLGWTPNPVADCAVKLNNLVPGDSVPSERPEKEGVDSLYATKVKLTKEEKAAIKAEKAK